MNGQVKKFMSEGGRSCLSLCAAGPLRSWRAFAHRRRASDQPPRRARSSCSTAATVPSSGTPGRSDGRDETMNATRRVREQRQFQLSRSSSIEREPPRRCRKVGLEQAGGEIVVFHRKRSSPIIRSLVHQAAGRVGGGSTSSSSINRSMFPSRPTRSGKPRGARESWSPSESTSATMARSTTRSSFSRRGRQSRAVAPEDHPDVPRALIWGQGDGSGSTPVDTRVRPRGALMLGTLQPARALRLHGRSRRDPRGDVSGLARQRALRRANRGDDAASRPRIGMLRRQLDRLLGR